nr:MAG TPA: hypothetical protein [Caudoviricetes sp.]
MITQSANKDQRSISVSMDELTILQYTETANSLKSNCPTHKLSFGEYAFDSVLDTIFGHSNMILIPKNPRVVIESDSLHDKCIPVDENEIRLICRLLGLPIPSLIIIIENISPRIVGKRHETAQIFVFTLVVDVGNVFNTQHDVILSERLREGLQAL